ncbi:ABC transporter ATP-binding protein [Hoeflea marina]
MGYAPIPGSIAEFRGATKLFGEVVAADHIDLAIFKGEFLSFLGPSGCGKTTALRMLAGFETPSRGDVLIDGDRVNDMPPHRRPVNMVFQHYALFPHLNVFDNIAYGLRQRRPRPGASEIATKVERTLETVRLPGYGKRRIWEMSGGQQQRVALARALVNEPKLLLLDEPMAALDRKLRREMQIELQTLQRQLGITFVLVTHDQEEALSMSDRICLMRGGRIVQIGSPRSLYDEPASRYVADFVGKSNFFEGRLSGRSAGIGSVETRSGMLLSGRTVGDFAEGQTVAVSIRPEQCLLSQSEPGEAAAGATRIKVRIRNRIFLGEHTEYLVESGGMGEFLVHVSRQADAMSGAFEAGEEAWASWPREAAIVLENDATSEPPKKGNEHVEEK